MSPYTNPMQVAAWIPEQTRSLLDVGCNVGELLCQLRRAQPSLHLAGIDIDEAALRAFVAGRLAAHKIPSRILFRDSLPMTTTQRVAKDLLRQEYGRAASQD